MIRYTKGNLFDSDAEALVNTVNTEGVMGKGIALQFKEAYPDNYRLYRKACKDNKVQVGKMFITEDNKLTGRKIIVNFPTKRTWRKPSEYVFIKDGLESLRNEIINKKIHSIAIPPLGTNNGGLDWTKVKQMIIEALADLDCVVYLYEPSDAIVEKMKAERVKLTPARAMMLDVLCDMIAYGEFASVFAAEKVVYFLQRMGAADVFKVNFMKNFYGPYSRGKVSHVLHYLNGSYIKGMAGMQVKPFEEIWILPDTPKVVAAYLAQSENEKYRVISERTKTFLRGYYSTYSLELMSTLDFILADDAKWKNWRQMDSEDLINGLKRELTAWSSRKDRLFSDSKFLPKFIDYLKTSRIHFELIG